MPVTAMPLMAMIIVIPVTGSVAVSVVGWRFPAAAGPYISSVLFAPVFIYPHVAWARCGYADYCLPYRPYTYVYLRLAAVCAC